MHRLVSRRTKNHEHNGVLMTSMPLMIKVGPVTFTNPAYPVHATAEPDYFEANIKLIEAEMNDPKNRIRPLRWIPHA